MRLKHLQSQFTVHTTASSKMISSKTSQSFVRVPRAGRLSESETQ